MTAPTLRGRGTVGTSTSIELKLSPPANTAGDLAVLYVHGRPGGTNTGWPDTPSGWNLLYTEYDADSYELVAWRKVPAAGLDSVVRVYAGDGQGVAKGWWGFVDAIGGVAWPTYGWLNCPGGTGNYGAYARTTLSGTPTLFSFNVRVRLDAVGVAQWFAGWGDTAAGFGMQADNKLIVYVNNTLGNPIGNAASTVAMPTTGLVGREVWLRGEVRTNAECRYWYSFADVPNAVAVAADEAGVDHWTELGVAVTGTNAGTTFRLTNSGALRLGTRSSLATGFVGDLLSYYESSNVGAIVPLNINFTEPQPGVVETGTAEIVYTPTEDGVDSPIEEFAYSMTSSYPGLGDLQLNGRNVAGDDRFLYHIFAMEHIAASETATVRGGLNAPGGWHNSGARLAKVSTRSVRIETMTMVADASTVDVPVDATRHNYDRIYYFTLVIRGRATVVRPPLSPQSPRISLGCAESYTLFITDQTYRQRIEQVGWTKLKWERVLDDISKASATIPDRYGGVACLAQVGGLVPWQYGLLIERDDQAVWSGPIVNVSRRGDDIQVEAADTLVRYQKRLLKRGLSFEYKQADAGLILHDIFAEHAYLTSDAWELPVPQVNTQVPITRALRPRELKMAWDLISELLDDSVDMYVMNGTPYVWEPNTGWCYQTHVRKVLDGPYNMNYDFVYGTFTEDAWVERPDWSIDGPGQANYVAVPGVESGEFGYRRIQIIENAVSQARYGVLDFVDADRVELPEDVHPTIEEAALLNRARTLIALRSFAPAVVSGGELSQSAPINVDHLRPGSLWKLDVWDHGFGQMLTAGRLRRVEVDVTAEQTGIKEAVVPTLSPPGWEDDG